MAVIEGGGAGDTLTGTNLSDKIFADTGADLINAGKGADQVSGGGGDDKIAGGAGDDVLYGYGHADVKADSGSISIRMLADGLSSPVFGTSPPGDAGHLYILEKETGRIEVLDTATGELAANPLLDLPDNQFTHAGERGLLGLAFHPDYAENGKFYVYVTNTGGDIEVREYTTGETGVADPASAKVLMTIEHSAESNHNGGWIGFGPDGYLYIDVGDGGGGGDPENDAQDITDNKLGKILRIDVNGDDFGGDPSRNYAIPDDNPFVGVTGDDEIWAYGLRNPWRASFDRATGDFYVGDVGQGAWEEVDFIAAGSPGGQNFGWHVLEGRHVYDDSDPGNPDPDDPSLVPPLVELPHDDSGFGAFALTGGYVYRGPGGGQGLYFFADYVTDNFWSFRQVDGEAVDFANRNGQLVGDVGGFKGIASFAEDGMGRLYGISLNGQVFLITPSAAAGDGGDRIDGGAGDDKVYGGAGADKLSGGADDDILRGGINGDVLHGDAGADTLLGQAGADVLVGGAGKDRLEGGGGKDVFVYLSVADSRGAEADRIVDLQDGDRIDLRRIDADTTQDGDQAFTLVNRFHHTAGEARLHLDGGRTILSLDVDGDGKADAMIYLLGDHTDFSGFIL